jgi:protein O-GlcNAc transferase
MMSNVAEALALGARHQQAGQLAEAERTYRQVLDIEPHNAEALHRLGTLSLRAGDFATAAHWFEGAIRVDGSRAGYHFSLGEAHRRGGALAPAMHAYAKAIALEPDLAMAHTNLGIIHYQQGDLAQALACFAEAARINPSNPQAMANLGRVHFDLGELAQAERSFRREVELKPDNARAHYNLGSVLQAADRVPEACDSFRRALELNPQDAESHNNLGILLNALHTPAEAESHFRQAIRVQPQFVAAYNNLALALRNQERYLEAVEQCRTATTLNADFAEAHLNLAGLLQALGRLDEAVSECERAIGLRPELALAHNNLGSCLHARGQIEDALPCFRRAVELLPDDGFLQSNLAHALNYAPSIGSLTIFGEHVRWGQRHADTLPPVTRPVVDRSPARRLRIGYVSAYFREHAISVFTEPILTAHDHRAFEVACYSDVQQPDVVTSRFQSAADLWTDTATMSDAALAERIAADQVDILVDLTGHLEGHRLLAFARRPAPVQVTYIGYQNTTGMRAMDYRLTDEWSDPPGTTDRFYTEQLIRLSRAFFCYRPFDAAPQVNDLPALSTGRVTFGSFNKLAKITSDVLSTWAQILACVPGSRLLVLADPSDAALARMRSVLSAHGVASERLEFVGKRPRGEYLQLHEQVDIALDTFPFNGHTTVCEALWMGVPVIVMAGETYVSRFGGSALVNLDLQDLIATSPAGYIESAVQLAGDLDRLQALRATLRQRMQVSPLLDAAGFTRNLEAVYRQMWTRWCSEP